ncbi:hypothetical protein ACL02S_01810 [Nocardia sp. 004]|uniref:hypothetical protein n=1 Tax=Nocardia sp. 004 TaxID=3385978 RepID=UPI0039A0CD80
MRFGRGLFGRRKSGGDAYAAFGLRALAIVRAQPSIAGAEFDADEFVIICGTHDGAVYRIGLITPLRRAEGAPEAVANEMLERYLLNMIAAPGRDESEWSTVAPRLRPVIRQAGELAVRVEGMSVAENTLWRPVLPCLMERVVIDSPTAMKTVTPQDLAEWGVDAETVFATARNNMAELAYATVSDFDPAQEELLYLPDEDGELYAGALPLVSGWLSSLGSKSGARPLVFVPGSTGVFMGLATSPERVAQLVGVALRMYDEAPRQVSPIPYTLDAEGRLVPFTVPRDHPAWETIRVAESSLAAEVYGRQYEGLHADSEEGRIDYFVAELLHLRAEDGTEMTATAWTDGVPTLLPRVHQVGMVDLDTGVIVDVPWDVLAREIALEPVPGLFPVRYGVEFHPDEQVMARLAAAASMS